MGETVAVGVGPAIAIKGVDLWLVCVFLWSISVGRNAVVDVSPPRVKGVDDVGPTGVGEGVAVGAGLVVVAKREKRRRVCEWHRRARKVVGRRKVGRSCRGNRRRHV